MPDPELVSFLKNLDASIPSHVRHAARLDRNELMEIARTRTAPYGARRIALKALALNPDAKVLTLLRQLAHDEDMDLTAIDILSEIDNPQATQILVSLLKLPRVGARAMVVRRLAELPGTRRQALEVAMRDLATEVIKGFLVCDCRPGENAVDMLNLLFHHHDEVRSTFVRWLDRGFAHRGIHPSDLPKIRDALLKAAKTEKVKTVRNEIQKLLNALPST